MRPVSLLPPWFVLPLLLIGCTPFGLYHKAGVPVAEMQRARLGCEVSAVQSAPVANQIRRTPPRYIPARRHCNAAGNCYYRGGYWIDGDIYTVDVNAGLRNRVERQCMADQGFVYITLPNCASGVASQVPVRATTVLPPVGPQSCVIRNPDGTWQIVDVAS